jgi:aspartate/glutamate racemase
VIVLATNTMHKLASEMMAGVKIPFVHIADATAQAIKTKEQHVRFVPILLQKSIETGLEP